MPSFFLLFLFVLFGRNGGLCGLRRPLGLALFPALFRNHDGCAAACREQQNDRPEHDDAENERADRVDQTARARLCRLRQLRAEAAALGVAVRVCTSSSVTEKVEKPTRSS